MKYSVIPANLSTMRRAGAGICLVGVLLFSVACSHTQPFTRQWGWTTSTDISHSKYRKYLNSIATILRSREVFLYAAGHDHNLQLFSGTGPVKYHLISGSGSKRDPVTHNDQTLLAWEKNGFFVVDIYTDASARPTAVGDTVEEELVFELR